MIRLVTLGVPACYLDDVELVDLPAQKTRFAVLIYLALERNVSRDDAAALFWAESGEERARHALSQSIYELKRLLGDEWLDTQSGRLVVTDKLILDAHEMNRLADAADYEAASDLFRGPFLSGFFLPNCKGFETWVDKQRSHLERLHRKTRRETVNSLATERNLAQAIEVARQWVSHDPLDDEANHRLIELLAHINRTEALREYASYERRLRDELDIEPLENTRSLVESLRAEKETSSVLKRPPQTRPVEIAHPSEPARPHEASSATWGRARLALLLTIVALAVWGAWRMYGNRPEYLGGFDSRMLDSTRYVIIPFTYESNVPSALSESHLLQDALERWEGISVVDVFQVRDALSRTPAPLRPRDALAVARSLGAGKYIRGDVSFFGGTIRAHAVLYDAMANGKPISDRTIRVPPDLNGADSLFAALAEHLLFAGEHRSLSSDAASGTLSWPARRAFLAGLEAIQTWDLAKADTQFSAAMGIDPTFARSRLWLGLVRSWARADTALWYPLSLHVIEDSLRLTGRERILARALYSTAQQDYPTACVAFERLTKQENRDFVAWYGLADCLSRDQLVLRNASSPSGWSFRSSYHAAASAYQRAFHLLPSMHVRLADGSYEVVRRALKTNSTALRRGRAFPSDTTQFQAYAAFGGDTLEFVPYPTADIARGRETASPASRDRAVQHQRAMFRDIARFWASTFPRSPEALQAVALSLELLGDRTCVDTLAKARPLATTKELQVKIALQEFAARVKFGFPHSTRDLARARAQADTLLSDPANVDIAPIAMAAVAVWAGRGNLAAEIARTNRAQRVQAVPTGLWDSALPLTVYAALGGPSDSIRVIERRFLAAIRRIPPAQRIIPYSWAYVRSAMLAFPNVRLIELARAAEMSMTVRAQMAFADGAFASAKAQLTDIAIARKDLEPEDIAIEALLAEADLLRQMSDLNGAYARIMPTLEALPITPPELLLDPVIAAATLRAGGLAAELSTQRNEQRATRLWAGAVTTLIRRPDPLLQPLADRLARLSRDASR